MMRRISIPALLCCISTGLAQQPKPHVEPEQRHFHYLRDVTATAPVNAQVCAVLDEPLLEHAAATLDDLRLYRGGALVPFALTQSGVADSDPAPAQILNAGKRGEVLSFDLAMPQRLYSEIDLTLSSTNFVGTAQVWGGSTPGSRETHLNSLFTLFDLTGRHLARNTTLALGESSFPYLHVELSLHSVGDAKQQFTADVVKSAHVPPSRAAQTLYTTLLSGLVTQQGHTAVARFTVPAHLPVERIGFRFGPHPQDFVRTVRVTARAKTASGAPLEEQASGEISSLHRTVQGVALASETLSVPVTLGVNLQQPAELEVAIENGDDAPVPVLAVELQTRERKLCFTAAATAQSEMLYYGDAALGPPRFDYSEINLRGGGSPAHAAVLGPERANPAYTPRTDTRPYTERHPEFVWLALLVAVGVLGGIALRSVKRVTHPR